jgi:hypothetical protein
VKLLQQSRNLGVFHDRMLVFAVLLAFLRCHALLLGHLSHLVVFKVEVEQVRVPEALKLLPAGSGDRFRLEEVALLVELNNLGVR